MHLTLADVFGRLVAEGLALPESVARARAALEASADTTPPWYARVIAGFGAWIATGCLIGFLVIVDLVDDETGAIIVGASLVAGGVFARRRAGPHQDFVRQLSLAVSLAGQVLVVVGVRGATESIAAAGLAALAMSSIVIPLVPDQAHRFMGALTGSIGLIATMASFKLAWYVAPLGPLGDVILRGSDIAAAVLVGLVAYVWRADVRDRSLEKAEMLEPVGYGTIAALLVMLVFSAWFAELEDFTRGRRSGAAAWTLGAGTTIAIAVALSALMVSILHELRATSVTAATPILLALLTLSTPGIVAAVALLALGFDRRNGVLIGIAIAFLIKFVSMYYYSMKLTLLEKSVVLVASGLLLLGARVYLELRYKPGSADA
jgi:uncharacterized membrane protein